MQEQKARGATQVAQSSNQYEDTYDNNKIYDEIKDNFTQKVRNGAKTRITK